ncbi:MAG: DUF4199 domain-containing protein [Rhodothermales bacterium]|nr:DUF4199 domain-containing protein [Rhodothermales bacterium]
MAEKQQSIILGSAVVTVLSTSYLGLINCLCCAGVVIGAMVAVWHYTSTNSLTMKTGEGAVLGLTVAIIGSLISAVLDYVLIKMGIRADQAIMQIILDTMGDQMPPESYDQMIEQMEQPVTIAGFAMQAVFGVVIAGIFGAIGGVIGASIFKKGDDAGVSVE